MQTKEYNGWTNYETWAVNLWLDNERGSHDSMIEEAKRCLEECERPETRSYSSQTKEEAATIMMSDILKSEHEEGMPEVDGVYADLLNAALSEVDWYEIAEHFIAAAKESVA